jgi:hypothetical protein
MRILRSLPLLIIDAKTITQVVNDQWGEPHGGIAVSLLLTQQMNLDCASRFHYPLRTNALIRQPPANQSLD